MRYYFLVMASVIGAACYFAPSDKEKYQEFLKHATPQQITDYKAARMEERKIQNLLIEAEQISGQRYEAK